MIKNYKDKIPKIHDSCYVSESVDIIGDVILEEDVNVWFGTVIRGDENFIRIGKGTNIQDNCTLHIARDFPCIVGENVTIGHGAIVHACTIGDRVLVGIGAIILNGAIIEDDVIIGAGSIVTPRKKIPSGSMVMGIPGKIVRSLTKAEMDYFEVSAKNYVELASDYKYKKQGGRML